MSFDEKWFVGSLITLVSSERHSVSDFRWTSSIQIFLDYSCCFPFNPFNFSGFSNIFIRSSKHGLECCNKALLWNTWWWCYTNIGIFSRWSCWFERKPFNYKILRLFMLFTPKMLQFFMLSIITSNSGFKNLIRLIKHDLYFVVYGWIIIEEYSFFVGLIYWSVLIWRPESCWKVL